MPQKHSRAVSVAKDEPVPSPGSKLFPVSQQQQFVKTAIQIHPSSTNPSDGVTPGTSTEFFDSPDKMIYTEPNKMLYAELIRQSNAENQANFEQMTRNTGANGQGSDEIVVQ